MIIKTKSFKNGDFVWKQIITSNLYINFYNGVFYFKGEKLNRLIDIHHKRNVRLGLLLIELKELLINNNKVKTLFD